MLKVAENRWKGVGAGDERAIGKGRQDLVPQGHI